MTDFVRNHFRAVGTYTCAGPYRDYFRSLPDDLRTLGSLLCGQILHRVTLRDGNTFANADLRYGDLTFFPWYRMRCEDDIFLTAPAMTAELFRLDPRGFVPDLPLSVGTVLRRLQGKGNPMPEQGRIRPLFRTRQKFGPLDQPGVVRGTAAVDYPGCRRLLRRKGHGPEPI